MDWAGPSAQGCSDPNTVTPASLILLFPNQCTLSASLPSHRGSPAGQESSTQHLLCLPTPSCSLASGCHRPHGVRMGQSGSPPPLTVLGPLDLSWKVFDFPFHLCSTFSSGKKKKKRIEERFSTLVSFLSFPRVVAVAVSFF